MRKFFQRNQKTLSLTVILVLLFFLFVLLRSVGLFSLVMNELQLGARTMAQGTLVVVEYIFSSKVALLKENGSLKEQVAALALDQAEAAQLKEDRQALEALENNQQEAGLMLLSAKVIGRSDQFGGDVLLVNRGSLDGIQKGNAVIVGKGIYIGTVIDAQSHRSFIQLLTDPAHVIGIALLNSEQTIGIAQGQGGVLLSLEFIPQSITLEPQTLVLTSGLNPGVPKGLVVGLIADVQKDEHNPFQSAHIEPIADLERLSVVGILTSTTL